EPGEALGELRAPPSDIDGHHHVHHRQGCEQRAEDDASTGEVGDGQRHEHRSDDAADDHDGVARSHGVSFRRSIVTGAWEGWAAGGSGLREADTLELVRGGAVSSDSVLVKAEEDFTTITMNRPERRNALSLGLLRDMTAAFRAAGDSSARGVILAATGRVFSAGHDFRDLAGADSASIRELLETCTELMVTMQSIPQPVGARVHGLATAAGCQLVAT